MNVRLKGVAERDIDLLLLEEFVASEAFLAWFLTRLGLEGVPTLIDAARSVKTSNGESDLEITARLADRQVCVLIENKIYAPLQPSQAKRYLARAELYRQTGTHDLVTTVLVAPEKYVRADQERRGFDHSICYEDVLEWFVSSDVASSRSIYKRALLSAAISRGVSGWINTPNVATTAFWHSYWELACSLAPELYMPEPSDKPAISGFIRFAPIDLPSGITLIHKAPYGHVDLQFSASSDRLDELRAKYNPHLGEGMRVEQAGKSVVVRISVTRIQLETPLSLSKTAVRESIIAAKRLLMWYRARDLTPVAADG